MGSDEYHPISHKGTNLTEAGGIGYTVVDSIDTMIIMGLDEEYQRARKWIEEKLSFDRDADFNTFEVIGIELKYRAALIVGTRRQSVFLAASYPHITSLKILYSLNAPKT